MNAKPNVVPIKMRDSAKDFETALLCLAAYEELQPGSDMFEMLGLIYPLEESLKEIWNNFYTEIIWTDKLESIQSSLALRANQGTVSSDLEKIKLTPASFVGLLRGNLAADAYESTSEGDRQLTLESEKTVLKIIIGDALSGALLKAAKNIDKKMLERIYRVDEIDCVLSHLTNHSAKWRNAHASLRECGFSERRVRTNRALTRENWLVSDEQLAALQTWCRSKNDTKINPEYDGTIKEPALDHGKRIALDSYALEISDRSLTLALAGASKDKKILSLVLKAYFKAIKSGPITGINPGSSIKVFMDELVLNHRNDEKIPKDLKSLLDAIESVRGIVRTDRPALIKILHDESSDYPDGRAAAIVKICRPQHETDRKPPGSAGVLDLVRMRVRRGLKFVLRTGAETTTKAAVLSL